MYQSSTIPRENVLPKDSLGCTASHLSHDDVLCTDKMVFRRKAAAGLHKSHVETPAADRGLLIGVSMAGGHRRRIWEAGRYQDVLFNAGDVYIRDFDNAFSADFDGFFDFFLIELAPDFLTDADRIVDGADITDLSRKMGDHDPVLHNLAKAMLPTLAEPDSSCPLFIEQMSTVISAHLLNNYGTSLPNTALRAIKLAPTAIRRAQEMLADAEDERVLIGNIASELGLSRNNFFVAFREATGVTPYQWLLNQRIDRARRLLRTTDLTLAEIALHCGFADQSHFTRVFGRLEGISPGRWRERTR